MKHCRLWSFFGQQEFSWTGRLGRKKGGNVVLKVFKVHDFGTSYN
jgi:hypothetical protein